MVTVGAIVSIVKVSVALRVLPARSVTQTYAVPVVFSPAGMVYVKVHVPFVFALSVGIAGAHVGPVSCTADAPLGRISELVGGLVTPEVRSLIVNVTVTVPAAVGSGATVTETVGATVS